jgi:hypothetical protein
MPFKSKKQEKWMWTNRPDIAQRWENKYGSYHGGKKLSKYIKQEIKKGRTEFNIGLEPDMEINEKSLNRVKFSVARKSEYHGGKIGDCPQCKTGELLSATDPDTGETYIYCNNKSCGFTEKAEPFEHPKVSENIFMQRMFKERPELRKKMGGKYTVVKRHGRKTKKKRTTVKRHVRKLKRYAVRVYFWNIDQEYGWTQDFTIRQKPNKKWLESKYDGVNEPEKYRIIGRVV